MGALDHRPESGASQRRARRAAISPNRYASSAVVSTRGALRHTAGGRAVSERIKSQPKSWMLKGIATGGCRRNREQRQ